MDTAKHLSGSTSSIFKLSNSLVNNQFFFSFFSYAPEYRFAKSFLKSSHPETFPLWTKVETVYLSRQGTDLNESLLKGYNAQVIDWIFISDIHLRASSRVFVRMSRPVSIPRLLRLSVRFVMQSRLAKIRWPRQAPS